MKLKKELTEAQKKEKQREAKKRYNKTLNNKYKAVEKLTEKQKKVVNLLVENTRIKKPFNKGEILRKSGYSNGVIKQPSRVLGAKNVLNATKHLIKQLKCERQSVLSEMQKKRKRANYRDLTHGLDITSKHIALLSPDEVTERVALVLPSELIKKETEKIE
ncbi:MAG: hypothetical protein U9M90_01260 [Patescibacteria group bacterium]|nr:hypothetical protein [Patescibacteria group bacterium]